MKKLIAMIGAVATAFGLFADATPFATSFEANEPGVSETTFTPGEGWTWQGDPLTLGVYAGDKFAYGEGALARRDSAFTVGLDSQVNYLKLETGTNALSRAVGDGNVFLDQLVKFTGFEEYQTNVVAGTKIAVWMSGIEQEGTAAVPGNGEPEFIDNLDKPLEEGGYEQMPNPNYFAGTPASDDYIAGETNLYITCAKVVDGQVQTVALKINGSYELDKWYRLTIKSLGDIYDPEKRQSENSRAGFIVYVNGNQVAAEGDAAKTLIEYDSEMTPTAKGYMAEGALFPAIDTTDATFATVGYQGIGAIDDIILDEEGPAFAQAIDVEITFPVDTEGNDAVEVDYIDVGGVHMSYPLAVPAGTQITVYFKAVDGKKIMSDLQPVTLTVNANTYSIDISDVEVEDVVAKKNGTIDLAASEMAAALAALVENDTIAFVADCSVYDSSEAQLYDFSSDTLITATENGWNVFVGADGACTFVVYADVENVINVEFEDGENGQFGFSGTAINGQLIVENGTAMTMAAVTVGNGALLKAAYLQAGEAITLAGTGKVVTATDPTELAGSIVDGESVEVIPTENDPEEGWYTYALATEPETTGFAIIIADADPVTTNYYETLDAAILAAGEDGLPSVVTILANAELAATTEIAKPITLDLNGCTLTYAAGLSKCINAPEAGTLTIMNGTITVADGRANIAGSRAIYLLHSNGVFTDLTLDLPGFEYVINKDCDLSPISACWSDDPANTLTCNNVTVNGNGSLFHIENAIATLTGCTATWDDSLGLFGNNAHAAAIYSSCGAVTTITGGAFTAPNALQTGNLGGDIIVNSGAFNGNIMSFMYKGDSRYEGNAASIKIVDGTFDGQFAFAENQAGACTKDEVTWDITGGKFKDDPSDYLADGYVATPEEGWYSVAQSADPVATVTIAGGEPVEYSDLHEALVDGSAAGSLVELIANVDLKNKAWEPVAGFAGTFDGNDFIISNLTVNVETGNGGMFGTFATTAQLRDFTIENVNVSAIAGRAGAVASDFNGNGGGIVSNVTVCGTIQIVGKEYVGAFIGHGQYAKYIDCHVDGGSTDDSKVTALAKVGGFCGMGAEDSFQAINCTVENIMIESTDAADTKAGALMGRFHRGDNVVNCSAANCIVKGKVATIGGFAGRFEPADATQPYGFIINSDVTDVTLLDGDGEEIAYKDFGDLVNQNVYVGEGVEGNLDPDAYAFTAGTFVAYVATSGDIAKLAAKCAAGYEPIANQDGTYTITQVYPITVVNAGEKATVTIDQTGSVVSGDKITGTISDVAEGFKAFVFVDGVKVAVDNEGKFEGTATASAKITVAYAKDSAWYLDPFQKNTFINFSNTYAPGDFTLTEDEQYLFTISSRAGDGGTYMKQYAVEEFANAFGYEEPTPLASSAMKSYPTGFMGVAGIAASTAAGYAFSGSAYGAVDTLKDRTVAWPFNGKWDPKDEDRVVLTSDIPNAWQRMAPLVVSLDGKYVYANNYYQPYIYKLAIVKDEQSGAITGLQYTGNVWVLPDAARATAMTIGQVGGKEIIWASSNTKFFAFEPSAAAVGTVDAPVTNNLVAAGTHGYAFRQISVTGKEDGLLHLIGSIQDGVVAVFPITDDGFALAAETPITVLEKTNFCNGKGFQGFVALDDESMAFGQNIHPTLNVTQSAFSYEKKPANLIVRGKFVTEDEVAQPEDITPTFGAAVEQTFTAPTGYQITDVTVNGAAVAGFTAGSTFTFSSDALDAYTLVKMTVGIDPAQAVAQIGTKYYLTLQDAINAVKDGDEIDILKDFSIGNVTMGTIPADVNVTIDFNGKVISASCNDVRGMNVYGTLTFKDSSEAQTGKLAKTSNYGGFIDVKNGTLVLESGTLEYLSDAAMNFLRAVTNGHIIVNGGVINAPTDNGYALRATQPDATITVNAGKINGVIQNYQNAGTITIPATSTALFDRDQTAFCAEGYVTDEHGENEGDLAGWWFVTAGPTYVITYDYGAGTAPETANKAAFAAYAADRTFTLTKPTSDAEFDVWTASNEAITFEGDVMTIPADFNEAFTVTATYKAAPGPTWPQDWPGDADEKVVEKFATWSAANPGVDFTSEAVQNAFLMGVNADATIPTLKIESIAVEGDTATIVVSAEGVDLETGINGVLYVDGTNELGAEWATTEVEIGSAAEFTDGKATFTVPNAKFMKAGVGFKAPAVEPVE